MKIWERIRQLNFRQLFRLGGVLITHPWFILPTVAATKRTMEICDKHFGSAHHRNNKSNAFRHALWNILICKTAYKVTRNNEKSIAWAKKITTLHENLMPNKPLEEAMDLHNNEIGRRYFLETGNTSEVEIISFLKLKMEEAIKVATIEEIHNHKKELIFLE